METSKQKYPVVKDTLKSYGIRFEPITKPSDKGKPNEVGISVPDRNVAVPKDDRFVCYIRSLYPYVEIVNLWAHPDSENCLHDITGLDLVPVRR